MLRIVLALSGLAALAACEQAAEESDDPGAMPDPAPATAAATTGTTQEASDTTSAPPPLTINDPVPPKSEPKKAAAAKPSEFAQCGVCHKVEPGGKAIGPSLAGVYGAKAGHVGDYAYSAAMRGSGLTWDEATLDKYLEAPLKTVPGTKMSYAGMKDPAKRQAVIAYLKTL